MPEMKTLTIGSDTFKIVDDDAVHFYEQTLTEEQRAQARTNIGAISVLKRWSSPDLEIKNSQLYYPTCDINTHSGGRTAETPVGNASKVRISSYQWLIPDFPACIFLDSNGNVIDYVFGGETGDYFTKEFDIPTGTHIIRVNGHIERPLIVELEETYDLEYLLETKADNVPRWQVATEAPKEGYYATEDGGESTHGAAEYIVVDVEGATKVRGSGYYWPVAPLYMFFNASGQLVSSYRPNTDGGLAFFEADVPNDAKTMKLNGHNSYHDSAAKANVSLLKVLGMDDLFEEICPSGKKLITLGDSITALGTGDTGWVKYFIEKTQCELVANVAVNGAWLMDKAGTVYDGNPVFNGSDDNVNNVLGNQVQKIINNGYEAPDIIMIAIGTNAGINITKEQIKSAYYDSSNVLIPLESVDRTTSAGAYRWCLEKLHSTYPNATIFWCTPIMGYQGTRSAEAAVDYAESLRIATEYTGQIMIETIRCGINGVNEFDNGNGEYLADGLHPNANGAKRIGYYNASVVKTFLGNLC